MKKFKTIISLLLAAVMLIGCTGISAFAAYPDKITTLWDEDFYLAGEISLGETSVSAEENYSYYYYVLNAENDGYYSVNYDYNGEIGWIYIFEEWYSNHYGQKQPVVSENCQQIIYLYAGENYVGVCFDEIKGISEKISIEYMGAEITDITFDAGTEYPLILESDIYNGSSYIKLYDFALNFDTGKTVELNGVREYFNCYSDEEIVIGENNVEIEVDSKKFAKTLTVAKATDFIEKVEVVSGDIYQKEYYDGGVEGTYDLTLKVTYTDGTSITARIGDEISLKNGNPNNYRVSCWPYEGTASVKIANHEFLEITYEKETASLAENLKLFASNIKNEFYYISRIPARAEEIFNQNSAADTLRAFGDFVSFVNNQFLYAIGDIYTNIVMLINSVS
ncbi:MAG: hypothetical protein IJZ07_00080 [Clostridia bacterium]|nr:hypothetical protein [Clostridia bacterium]